VIIGIDLGTTNSAVAVWRDGRAELIPNSLGHRLTPSAVSIDDSGQFLVGLAARERYATHPNETAVAFKRYMGARRDTKLGKHTLLPEELSAMVLRTLKADAEAYLGEPVTEAVITVPAYFNDKQRKATRRAGELAGLKVERLLNEPTAAALAYGIHNLGAETQFLVFDLGGGTFDVSILEIFEGVIEVRASTGDNHLGGEDFNAVLVEMMQQRHLKAWGTTLRDNPELAARLNVAAEKARRELTERNEALMSVVWKEVAYDLEVTTDSFETAAEKLVTRLKEPVLRAIRDGGVQPDALSEIVMVGGSTRMPLVRRAVTRMFGRFPATGVDPDEAVAMGAAVQAGLKSRDAALNEVVLTDVCPYSLGVDIAEQLEGGGMRTGIFSPVIERNTVVPASRVKPFSTLDPRQKTVEFRIYQGESRLVADNVFLGKVDVPVPPVRSGSVELECRFSYDINGLLEVDILVPQTGERRELVIVDDDSMSAKELETRRKALAVLKQHPKDNDAIRAVLARGARCYEEQLGDRRTYVAQAISAFEAVLERQEPRAIETARVELSALLDEMEGQTWF
jgi:molecular chaperone HscC